LKGGRVARWTSTFAFLALVAAFLRQRRRPVPLPPRLSFLLENPVTEAFVGAPLLLERLGLEPGMRVLDAGCGPGRLTVPIARAVGPEGEVVALDSQEAMLARLRRRVEAEGLANVRPRLGKLGEAGLPEQAFDRIVLAMVLGEVRDREAALRELYRALKTGGMISITEAFGDPDYRRPATVCRETGAAGFRLVARYGRFPAYTMNFVRG
jgi:ubiquinone/menaquinone biosynthesis C-methylase UbiE